jgi:predicted CXXCH cytochrome family protein
MKTTAAPFDVRRRSAGLLLAGLVLCGLASVTALADNPNSIIFSKHNLSISGPGSVRAAQEADICIFCHTPHNAGTEGPLWNHQGSVATYIPYSSSTLKATVGQPTGSSKLCLSCHDGTVALGAVYSRYQAIAMQSGNSAMPAGPSLLGTDLSADHPVSFPYDSALVAKNGELRDPSLLNQDVRLENGQVQCISCHDPHNNQYGGFLVRDNTGSAMCQECHVPNQWSGSVHAISTAAGNVAGVAPRLVTPRATVAANACENCHRTHAAEMPKRLLNYTRAEQNCLACHDGSVANKNLAQEFNKISIHPITTSSDKHDPTEAAVPVSRHVSCDDCHNSHATRHQTATAPNASGALAGVRGVSATGTEVRTVQYEYQLCVRCPGDSSGPARVQRQFVETNTRKEFSPGNISFHPVEAVGKNTSTPSLIVPWSISSRMYCGDCHNNNQSPATGGTGPNGPHGSVYTPLLERQLLLTDRTAYNANNFALCYKCHKESVVNSEQATSWKYHKKHIVEFRAACTTCHDSHGATQPHLINFNVASGYVQPYNGVIKYTSTGVNHGTCTLRCHNASGSMVSHSAESY